MRVSFRSLLSWRRFSFLYTSCTRTSLYFPLRRGVGKTMRYSTCVPFFTYLENIINSNSYIYLHFILSTTLLSHITFIQYELFVYLYVSLYYYKNSIVSVNFSVTCVHMCRKSNKKLMIQVSSVQLFVYDLWVKWNEIGKKTANFTK